MVDYNFKRGDIAMLQLLGSFPDNITSGETWNGKNNFETEYDDDLLNQIADSIDIMLDEQEEEEIVENKKNLADTVVISSSDEDDDIATGAVRNNENPKQPTIWKLTTNDVKNIIPKTTTAAAVATSSS
ncbi:hypothetical protein QE152_g606 [Popillia japonica]|uniref:Uncharacterized protein n=1 Tax=Popillia japonica TaxID=7064 RepID=A0AAW1NIA1_POPJA